MAKVVSLIVLFISAGKNCKVFHTKTIIVSSRKMPVLGAGAPQHPSNCLVYAVFHIPSAVVFYRRYCMFIPSGNPYCVLP